jgi:hypothetical protein
MDAFLAGRGYWVAWITAFVAGVQDDVGTGAWDKVWYVVALVAWPLAVRASSLKGPPFRGGLRLPARWRAALRRTAVRLRWPLAAAYVAVGAVAGQRRFGTVAFTVVATVAGGAAAAYLASRVAQDPETVSPPPPAATTTVSPPRMPPDGNPYAAP